MLVLTRKTGERIVIAGRITVEVLQTQGNRVRLGIHAPPDVSIHRQELIPGDAPEPSVREGNPPSTGPSLPHSR